MEDKILNVEAEAKAIALALSWGWLSIVVESDAQRVVRCFSSSFVVSSV